MSAIAWELPEDVRAVRDGLLDFRAQGSPAAASAHRDLFEDPRRLYREDGRFSDALKALIGEVRRVAAGAGYYNMCVPEALGGGGLAHLAYYVGWEALFRLLRAAELARCSTSSATGPSGRAAFSRRSRTRRASASWRR